MSETALVVAEKLDVAVLFTGDGMDRILKEIEAKAMAHVPDVSTDAGRKDIGSLAHKVARSKTLIDDMGKDVVADWKKKAKEIDNHRKTARDFLDDLKTKVRQPLTDWEAVEAVKKEEADRLEREKIEKRIADLAAFNIHLPFFEVAGWTDGTYEAKLIIAKDEYKTEQKRLTDEEAARKAESERLEKVRLEQEAEAKRLAEVQRKIEEQERKAKAEVEEANRIERESIEKERRAVEAEKAAIEKEKAVREAAAAARNLAIKEEKEAQERKAREAEKEAAELARQEALKPDKEKLLAFAQFLQAGVKYPEMKSEETEAVLKNARIQIYDIGEELLTAIEEL